MVLDSIVNVDEKYYSQILLKKNANKKNKIINSINGELKLDKSDDESDEN